MIKDLKELQALLKLCRKQGVTEINLSGTVIKFGDMPRKSDESDESSEDVPTEGLTPEQLMYFSAGGSEQ
jgi:hypothetical protein